MPGPYPLATLGPTISSTGISIPSYDDILQSLIARMKAIYGDDIYLAEDSQDGQMIAAYATDINDTNMAIVADFASRSPTYAQGAGLDSVVKINDIQRLVPTFTTVTLELAGVVGTVIENGAVSDGTHTFLLPPAVTIEAPGTVDSVATCSQSGNITALANTLTTIVTPQLGWQSATNPAPATPGNPVEADATLRARQSQSTELPAQSILGGIQAAIANLTGVVQVAGYENATAVVDSNGAPAHSIYMVIKGGTLQEIVDVIGRKKGAGVGTYGTTSGVYTDPVTQLPYTTNFFIPTPVLISVNITVHALTATGVNEKVKTEIAAALTTYLNSLGIGQPVQINRLYAPAYLNGAADGQLYEVTALQIEKNAGGFAGIDIPIAYNEISAAGPVVVTVS